MWPALINVLNWIFVHPIYPIVGSVVPLYLGLRRLKRRFPTAPDPAYVIGAVILIEMLIVPSVPRYLFEHATLAGIKAPLGSATLIMPDPPGKGAFRQVIMRYGRDPVVTTVEADCERATILYARRDDHHPSE